MIHVVLIDPRITSGTAMEFDAIRRGRNNSLAMGNSIMRLRQVVLRMIFKVRGLRRLLVLWDVEARGYGTSGGKRRHLHP